MVNIYRNIILFIFYSSILSSIQRMYFLTSVYVAGNEEPQSAGPKDTTPY